MTLQRRFAALFALLAISVCCANADTMNGHNFIVSYLFPDTGTIYSGPFNVVGGPSGTASNVGNVFDVTLSGDDIIVNNFRFLGSFTPGSGPFNGISITSLDPSFQFTSANVGALDNMGLLNSMITFDSTHIIVNFLGLNFVPGQTASDITVNGGLTETPEPGAFFLVASGLVGVGGIRRRR